MVFRLAQVTDPHFRGFAGARLSDFANKRAVGTVNLIVNRRRKHRMELLDALREDLRAQPIDHLALTGDLSNVSLESEFRVARRWIDGYSSAADRVTVIPGNHDAYVEEVVRDRTFERFFGDFQTDDLGTGAGQGHTYPFVRLRDGVALIGVNTCVSTGDMGAWGEIGSAQLARLGSILGLPAVKERVRVVLLHHPPVLHRGAESRNLRDRAELAALLARTGAELVLHGHDHRDERARLPGPGGSSIPVVGVASASYGGAPERRARYAIFEIEGPAIRVITRAHDEAENAFREVRRETI